MSLEVVFFWLGIAGYALGTLSIAGALVFRRSAWEAWAFRLGIGGLVAQTASLVARWAASGRLPYVRNYENLMAGVWCIVALYVWLGVRRPSLRSVGVLVLPAALLSLGYALTFDAGIAPETPSTKSLWLIVHVLFAWAAYSAYTVCAGLAAIELLKGRKAGVRPGSVLERAPSVPELQDLTFRFVVFGFLVNGVMIASGAIWAYELWGSYWRWDPVETWSLITWLAFGLYMHARLTLGWRGPRLAWLALFALFGVMMTFWGVQIAPSIFGTQYHLFRSIGETMEQTPRMR